jgi:hypothetical protein
VSAVLQRPHVLVALWQKKGGMPQRGEGVELKSWNETNEKERNNSKPENKRTATEDQLGKAPNVTHR